MNALSEEPLLPPAAHAWSAAEDQAEARRAALREHLSDSGYIVEMFEAPVDVALQSVRSGRPLLVLDEQQLPLAIDGIADGRARVTSIGEAAVWIPFSSLADRLGTTTAGEVLWIAPSVSLPAREGHDVSPWTRAYDLLADENRNIGAITIYAAGVGVLSLATPVTAQVLVSTVAFGTLVQPIVVLATLLGAGLMFAATLRALQTWVVEVVQRRLFVRLVSAIGARIPEVPTPTFEEGRGPELINRFFDVFTAQKTTAALLLGGIEALLTVIVGLTVLAFYHPWLLGLGGLILFGAAIVIFVFGRGGAGTSVKESKAKYAVAGWLEEMSRHVFALKHPGGGEFALRRLDRLASEWVESRRSHFRLVFRQVLGALALQVVASVALLGVGGFLVVSRELTIGQLVAAELIVSAVVSSLNKLGGKLESAYDLAAAADKLGVLLTLPRERLGGELLAPSHRVLSIHDVTTQGAEVEDLSLHVEAGERVDLVATATVRRALRDLLFGTHDPARGKVLLGGQDVRELRLSALRSSVYVIRDPETFPASIAENIRLGDKSLDSATLWKLLEVVGLSQRVQKLPQGLHTQLAPNGAPLERKDALRLTLARGLAARPAVLILDEVISGLHLSPEAARALGEDGMSLITLESYRVPTDGRVIVLQGVPS